MANKKILSVLFPLLSLAVPTPSQDASAPTASTCNGTYSGSYLPEYDQDVFLGVPYAQPPLNSLRFSPAQSLNSSFTDVKPATQYAPECVGYGSDDINYSESEDCLYLNVIRPHVDSTANASEPLPVAVWIHGGGYSEGGTQDRRYNLSFIVDNSVSNGLPVIGVSIGYRLSAWGLLYSNQVAGEGSANLALRDQRLALQWLQENIASFGGDPSKVTIWGESAGASSVGFHLLAYGGRDDNLFRAAVMESGNPVPYESLNGTDFYQPLYDNITANVPAAPAYASAHNLSGNASCNHAIDTLDCLRAASFDDLNTAFNTSSGTKWFPVIDGDFIQEYPSRQLAAGNFVKVPIIDGANSDEGASFAPTGINNTDIFVDLLTSGQNFGAQPGITIPDTLVNELVAAYPDDPCNEIPGWADAGCQVFGPPFGAEYRRAAAYQGDVVFIAARRQTCEYYVDAGVDAYCYRFNAIPFNQTSVQHFQEVAFVMDNVNGYGYEPVGLPFMDKPQSYVDLASLMSRSWASFFATMDPNAWKAMNASAVPTGASGGVPADWPKYNTSAPMDIVWDANVTSYAEPDTFRAAGIKVINDNAIAYQR